PVEGDLPGDGGGVGSLAAPEKLARFGVAEVHAAPSNLVLACCPAIMIAPEPRIFKGLTVQELGPRIKRTALPVRCLARSLGDHGFVNGIIMLPQFGQGDAKPKRKMAAV